MRGETNIVLFLTASLVVIVAPGPDNILVLTRRSRATPRGAGLGGGVLVGLRLRLALSERR